MFADKVIYQDGTTIENCEVSESERFYGFFEIVFPNGRNVIVNKENVTCIFESELNDDY